MQVKKGQRLESSEKPSSEFDKLGSLQGKVDEKREQMNVGVAKLEETNAIDWREVEDDADAAPRRYHAGWVLVGAGIAAGVSGLLYLLLRGEERSVALDVGPGHLQLRGRF